MGKGKADKPLRELASKLDENHNVRERTRQTERLLKWVSPNLTGVASCGNVGLNIEVMTIVAELWCAAHPTMTFMKVAEPRQQAARGACVETSQTYAIKHVSALQWSLSQRWCVGVVAMPW